MKTLLSDFMQARKRVNSGKILPSDIIRPGLLSNNEIQDISHRNIYRWVREKYWTEHDFERWLKSIRVIGYDDCT